MMSFKIRGDYKFLRKNWWSPTRKEWIPRLLQANKENWQRGVDPNGRPWKTLSPAYAKLKMEEFGPLPILRATGHMLDTAYITGRGKRFFVHTNDRGVYHQFGTDNMPARPWMGVPNKAMQDLADIAVKNILRKPTNMPL